MKVRIRSEGHGRTTAVMAVADDGTETPLRGVIGVDWHVELGERAVARLTVYAELDGEADVTDAVAVPPPTQHTPRFMRLMEHIERGPAESAP